MAKLTFSNLLTSNLIRECTRSTIIEFGRNDLNINCNSSKGSASWFNSSPSEFVSVQI